MSENAPKPLLVDVPTARVMLGNIGDSHIRRLMRAGHLQPVRLGGRVLLSVERLEALVKRLAEGLEIDSPAKTAAAAAEAVTEIAPVEGVEPPAKRERKPRKPRSPAPTERGEPRSPAPTERGEPRPPPSSGHQAGHQADMPPTPTAAEAEDIPPWEGPSAFADEEDDLEMGDPGGDYIPSDPDDY